MNVEEHYVIIGELAFPLNKLPELLKDAVFVERVWSPKEGEYPYKLRVDPKTMELVPASTIAAIRAIGRMEKEN